MTADAPPRHRRTHAVRELEKFEQSGFLREVRWSINDHIMIELLTWPTPNGTKPSIMLEELEGPYSVRLVNIGFGKQHLPAFLSVSPNNKIAAIIDRDRGDALDDMPGVDRWLGGISSRPAVQWGLRAAKVAIGRGKLPS
jgi:hypothetical protein